MSYSELQENFTNLRVSQATDETEISLIRSLCSQNDYGDALEARMLDYCDKRHLDGAEIDGILKAIADAQQPDPGPDPDPLPDSDWLGHDYIPDFGKFDGAVVVETNQEVLAHEAITQEIVSVKGRLDIYGALNVGTLLIYPGGEVIMHPGSKLIIRDLPFYPFEKDPKRWSNGIINLGYFADHGTEKTPFVRAYSDVRKGHDSILMETTVLQGWKVGDEILVPDTIQAVSQRGRHMPNQNDEVRKITAIERGIVSFDRPLDYDHPGFRDEHTGLERFPHICNLTRDIVIRSENPNGNRGHLAWHMRGYVDLRYTEFRDMGRTKNDTDTDETVIAEDGTILWTATNQRGRYPIHSHHSFGTPGGRSDSPYQSTISGCVVRDSPSWGITIHGSHYIQVKDNVLFGNTGAGIMEEDGTEHANEITENVIVGCLGHEKPQFKRVVEFTDGTKYRWETFGTNGSGVWITRQNSTVKNCYTYSSSGYGLYLSGYGFGWESMELALERGNPNKTRVNVQCAASFGREMDGIEACNCRGLLYWAWDQGPNHKFYEDACIGMKDGIVGWNCFGERGGVRMYHSSKATVGKLYLINDPAITALAERTEPLGGDFGTTYDLQAVIKYFYCSGYAIGLTPPTKGNKAFPHAPFYVESGAIDCPIGVAFMNTEDGEVGDSHITAEFLSGTPVRMDWKYDTQKVHAPFEECKLFVNGWRYWFDVQSPDYIQPPDGKGKQIVIIDGERVDIVGMTSQEVYDEYGVILGGVFKDS